MYFFFIVQCKKSYGKELKYLFPEATTNEYCGKNVAKIEVYMCTTNIQKKYFIKQYMI